MAACPALESEAMDYAPAMPCVRKAKGHRKKIREIPLFPFGDAAVARPVSSKEIDAQPKAQEARQKEWNRLREGGVWDESVIRDWKDVAAEARNEGK